MRTIVDCAKMNFSGCRQGIMVLIRVEILRSTNSSQRDVVKGMTIPYDVSQCFRTGVQTLQAAFTPIPLILFEMLVQNRYTNNLPHGCPVLRNWCKNGSTRVKSARAGFVSLF